MLTTLAAQPPSGPLPANPSCLANGNSFGNSRFIVLTVNLTDNLSFFHDNGSVWKYS